MQTEFITEKKEETKKLGKLLAQELCGGEVICLCGELGAGKTTFTQGLLEGSGAEKPYTSPTFVVMKEYEVKSKKKGINAIYHFDAYRVEAEDILNLGWEEIVADESNICIIEWADKIKKIIPERAIWIEFEWCDEKRRKIILR
jgi:tRNA threonylcarbamoyladenosine biosynthesis protein TsaE